jgi:uncharacterized protein
MKLDDLFDASRHVPRHAFRLAPRRAGRGLIWTYRTTLSPLVGFRCRHLPTCSDYADPALDRFGLWAGLWMTLARLLRCQPWGTSGLDFVPQALPEKSRWYMPWRFGRWRGTNDSPPTALAEPDAAAPSLPSPASGGR